MAITTLVKWIAISALILANALLVGFVALVIWASYVTAPTRGGMNVGEYMSALDGHIVKAGLVGFGALIVASVYWLIGMHRLSSTELGTKGLRAMKVSLVLVPLALALIYAVVLFASEDPAILRPPVRRGGD